MVCDYSCGDGYVSSGSEQCDDGDFSNGDGCSSSCLLEGTPLCTVNQIGTSVCGYTTCGDSTIDVGETCDDGGGLSGDGCSILC